MKKLLAVLLSSTLLMSMSVSAFAQDNAEPTDESQSVSATVDKMPRYADSRIITLSRPNVFYKVASDTNLRAETVYGKVNLVGQDFGGDVNFQFRIDDNKTGRGQYSQKFWEDWTVKIGSIGIGHGWTVWIKSIVDDAHLDEWGTGRISVRLADDTELDKL